MKPSLRAVSKPAEPVLRVDAAKSWAVYPDSAHNAAAWLRAVLWMQSRPSGSIWLLDTNKPKSKWRSLPTEEQ
jgi:hypothetical protein